MRERDPVKRLKSKVRVAPSGCWLWTGYVSPKGYGHVGGGGGLAHRVAYELLVGPIADGMQLDHLCRTRSCCNPTHLEAVTCRENLLRGETWTAHHAAKGACDNGHEFTPENTYVWRGSRYCRACRARREAARRKGLADAQGSRDRKGAGD